MSFLAKNKYKVLTAASILAIGRYLVAAVLSSGKGEDKPQKWSAEEHYWLRCPSGNIIYVEFDGTKNKQALILIHGLNANRYQWYYQREYFRNKYRLVYIDLPGHGKSLSPADLSIPSLAKDLQFIIEYFRMEQPIVYGHSMGGMVSLEYCIGVKLENAPKAVILQHASYTNPIKTIKFSGWLYPLQQSLLIPFFESSKRNTFLIWTLSWLNYLNGFGSAFFRYIFFTGKQTPGQLRFMSLMSAGVAPWVVAEAILQMMKFDASQRLGSIQIPALVIGAKNDRITRQEASEYISSQIKDSELILMEEGHLSLIENHEKVNKLVDRFIEKRTKA